MLPRIAGLHRITVFCPPCCTIKNTDGSFNFSTLFCCLSRLPLLLPLFSFRSMRLDFVPLREVSFYFLFFSFIFFTTCGSAQVNSVVDLHALQP